VCILFFSSFAFLERALLRAPDHDLEQTFWLFCAPLINGAQEKPAAQGAAGSSFVCGYQKWKPKLTPGRS
jgi:hypothetical protein